MTGRTGIIAALKLLTTLALAATLTGCGAIAGVGTAVFFALK